MSSRGDTPLTPRWKGRGLGVKCPGEELGVKCPGEGLV